MIYGADVSKLRVHSPKVRLKVLVACEFSGIVRDAFSARGANAWSCDLLPSERVGNHIQRNVIDVLDDDWDLMIAHPPCTYLANSGVRWLYGGKGTKRDIERWARMDRSARFFRVLLNAPIPKVAVENPIMHRYGRAIIGEGPMQIIQPWQYGHRETKATCLWLRGLPMLAPTNIVGPVPTDLVERRKWARVHCEPPSLDRWKNRSRTYEGVAAAMAVQWGRI